MGRLNVRVRLEIGSALGAGILGLLTAFWRDWIEVLTGWDPDQRNGSLEWLIVVGLLGVSAAMALSAYRHWKLLITSPAGDSSW